MSHCCVLWDASQLWGILLLRALQEFEVPLKLVRAKEISQHLHSGKSPSMLIVPGGTARLKSQALGASGLAAVRAFVEGGGHYLGFCGGAGLGLNSKNGLALCPWERDNIRDRLQHLVSGYMRVELPQSGKKESQHYLVPNGLGSMSPCPTLPVWWPGRFCVGRPGDAGNPADNSNGNSAKPEEIEVLAAYSSAGPDFRVADLALDTLPPQTLRAWEKAYGIRIGTDFMRGQPCIIHSRKGRGSYTLSYSHLETPDSPDANLWLAHLLRRLGGLNLKRNSPDFHQADKQNHSRRDDDRDNWTLRPWDVAAMPLLWQDRLLLRASEVVDELFELGREHGLFYRRSSWLIGWRTGIPGSNMNNLRLGLRVLLSAEPSAGVQRLWAQLRPGFAEKVMAFREGVIHLLLAERLAATLAKTAPEAISLAELQARRLELFGPPMEGGGLYLEIWRILDALLSEMWVE